MAIRGVMATVAIYPENYDQYTNPLYLFQNHFEGSRIIQSALYTYNSFTVSPISEAKDSQASSITINFAGTAANIDLVEAAIANRYAITTVMLRWNALDGLDNPTNYNTLAFHDGFAIQGETDFSSVSLIVNPYSDTSTANFPWRKVPWTILGPLATRSS